MKRVIYIFSALLLLASCMEKPSEEVRQIPLNISICFDTKASGSGEETVQPVINSVRVLGFDANDAGKPCVLNEFFPFGYTVLDAGNYYKVQLSSPIIINSQSTKYDFYVVLNEGEYQLASQTGDATVSDLLTDITAGSSVEPDFTAIYAELAKNDKTDTSGDPVGEPAFLMCASSLGFEISEAEQKLPDAKDIQFIVPGGRTMAQIIINKITSAPISDANEAAVPLVFVKSVTLENVPSTIDWDASSNAVTEFLDPITVGGPVEDAQHDSYYPRVWPGYLTTTLNVNAEQIQTTDAKLWNPKGFAELFQDGIQLKDVTDYQPKDYAKGNPAKDAKLAYNSIQADLLKKVFNGKVDKGDNKNKDLFTVEAENIKSFYSVTSVITSTSNVFTISNGLNYTDDVWTVNLGQNYYVPENIASSKSDATFIKVVLAVANPSLDLSGVDNLDFWPTPGSLNEDAPTYHYYLYDADGTETQLDGAGAQALKDATAHTLAQANMHIVYKSDWDTELPWTDPNFTPTENMNVYIDGFYRKATGTSTITVNQNQKGGVFKWNVPSTGLYEFNIPVNNNLDEDGSYSIKRNTRYKVTLHVNNDPRPDASTSAFRATKSMGGGNLGITAIVETEEINDYED